jgi:hypothetical protein
MDTQGIPMKTTTAASAAICLALAVAMNAGEARAQYPDAAGGRIVPRPIPSSPNTYAPSYSYWTAAYYGYPPRQYVGYVEPANDFPYFGRPYGSPSDPWSWPAMAGYSSGVPTRYYAVLP